MGKGRCSGIFQWGRVGVVGYFMGWTGGVEGYFKGTWGGVVGHFMGEGCCSGIFQGGAGM